VASVEDLPAALIRHPHHDPDAPPVQRIENGSQLPGAFVGR